MTVVSVCDTLQGNSAVAMIPVSIATTTDKSGPNLQLALQLLVLFYIIKQLLHTPSLNSVFITTLGVYIPLGLQPRGIFTPWVVINHTIQ